MTSRRLLASYRTMPGVEAPAAPARPVDTRVRERCARCGFDRGEQFYRMAAEQMRAAKDAGATWVEIADALGHEETWATRIVAWAENPANGEARAPFGGEQENQRKAQVHAKNVLREKPD